MPNTVAAQPTQRANALQPKDILICNTSNIDSMRHGRPQTVIVKEANGVLPNGVIVTLAGTSQSTGEPELDHVNTFTAVKNEAADVKGKFIIVSPEINVEQYRRIDNSIANHMLIVEETYTAYELAARDRIEYSEGHFATDLESIVDPLELINREVQIDTNGKLVVLDPGATGCFKIVAAREQRQPLMMALGGAKMPEAYLMIKLEVK